MKVITIGGNIGCGKSTLLSRLSRDYETYKEPIDKWGSWLDLFYTNPERYAFSFQMKILHDFMYLPSDRASSTVITERSPLDSLNVFCKTLKDSKTITHMEYNLFKEYVDTIGWKPDVFVYLKTTPDVCIRRMRERSRECETGVDIEYIQKIHHAYERFVDNLKDEITVYEIDANQSIDDVYRIVTQKIETQHNK